MDRLVFQAEVPTHLPFVQLASSNPEVAKENELLTVSFSASEQLLNGDGIKIKLPKWDPMSSYPKPHLNSYEDLKCTGIVNMIEELECEVPII